jgi:hypothetical protein
LLGYRSLYLLLHVHGIHDVKCAPRQLIIANQNDILIFAFCVQTDPSLQKEVEVDNPVVLLVSSDITLCFPQSGGLRH